MAEASEPGFLVTGGKELLSLKWHKSTRMISPAAMIELLKESEEPEVFVDQPGELVGRPRETESAPPHAYAWRFSNQL